MSNGKPEESENTEPSPSPRRPSRRYLAIVALAVALAALVMSLIEGATEPLPRPALGLPLLLHLERTIAVFLLIFVPGELVLRGLAKEAPKRVDASPQGGVGVEYDEFVERTGKAVETLQGAVDKELPKLSERLARVEGDLAAVKGLPPPTEGDVKANGEETKPAGQPDGKG